VGAMTGAIVAVVVIALGTVLGLVRRRRDGVVRQASSGGAVRLDPADLGAALGERATLVQFSSAFCAPCRATRRTLEEIAAMVDGVAHIEIDAESRLDLVRSLGIVRTPTSLILGPDGRVVRRASGQPRKSDVIAALGEAIGS
jgi:thiol-disulfide isomerase/thioredoxin